VTELFIISFLIVLNGLLSMAEMAVISSRRSRLESEAQNGNKRAARLLRLLDAPGEFLSTIQIGVTLIGILTGVYGGATIAEALRRFFIHASIPDTIGEPISFGIVVLVISYFSLVFGELVPKQIGLSYPETLAKASLPAVALLFRVCSPAVTLLDSSTRRIVSLLKLQAPDKNVVTEDEIQFVVAQGVDSGAIEDVEQKLVQEVLRLGDRSVLSVMTPRADLVWLSVDDSLLDNWAVACESGHAYFPVGRVDLDDCLGIVSFRNLALQMTGKGSHEMGQLLKPALKVSGTMPVLRFLEQLKTTGSHLALITDEYGGIDGLATVSDVMTAVFGEVESGSGEAIFVKREDGSWLVDGAADIVAVFERLGIPSSESREKSGYYSLAGFMLNRLGHVPEVGEKFSYESFGFEVVDMDHLRIDKILIIPPPSEDQEQTLGTQPVSGE
jgi:putative hemolysin